MFCRPGNRVYSSINLYMYSYICISIHLHTCISTIYLEMIYNCLSISFMHTMHLYLFNSIQLSASVSLHSYSVIFYYVCIYLNYSYVPTYTYIHIYVLIFFLAQYPQLKLCLPVQPLLSVLLLSLFPPSLFRT